MTDNIIESKNYHRKDLRRRLRLIRKEMNLPYVPDSTLRFKRIVRMPDDSINYVYFYEPAELRGTIYGLPHYILMDSQTDKIRWAENEEIFMIMHRELPEVVQCL